jgi:predicted AAA+ superfamily ATPase
MFTSAFIFFRVSRFDIKGKRLLEIHEKYYAGDIGLKHNLLGYKIGDISGHLENIVYLELLARGYKVEIGKYNEREIDFIASTGNEHLYIQVAYLLHDQKTIDREFGALEMINDNFTKLVLSMDKFHDANRNGIKWMNLIEFLIKSDY